MEVTDFLLTFFCLENGMLVTFNTEAEIITVHIHYVFILVFMCFYKIVYVYLGIQRSSMSGIRFPK